MEEHVLLSAINGVKTKKKDLQRATVQLLEILNSYGGTPANLGRLLARLPAAVFDDVEDKMDPNIATDVLSKLLIVNDRGQRILSDAVRSVIARESMERPSPEPNRPRRELANERVLEIVRQVVGNEVGDQILVDALAPSNTAGPPIAGPQTAAQIPPPPPQVPFREEQVVSSGDSSLDESSSEISSEESVVHVRTTNRVQDDSEDEAKSARKLVRKLLGGKKAREHKEDPDFRDPKTLWEPKRWSKALAKGQTVNDLEQALVRESRLPETKAFTYETGRLLIDMCVALARGKPQLAAELALNGLFRQALFVNGANPERGILALRGDKLPARYRKAISEAQKRTSGTDNLSTTKPWQGRGGSQSRGRGRTTDRLPKEVWDTLTEEQKKKFIESRSRRK